MDRSPATRRAGLYGEAVAARHLSRRGLRILARNWRCGRYELDLVVADGEVVAFVEVKARGPGPQVAVEAVGRAQRRRIRRAAEAWIHDHPGVGLEFRFDVVGVRLRRDGGAEVEHVRGAFFAEDC